jgi:hypothetical protein
MPTRYALACLSLLAVTACGAVGQFTPNGELIWFEFDSVGDDLVFRAADSLASSRSAQRSELAARAQAAIDFRCPVDALAAEAIHPGEVFRVTGCGRGGVFKELQRYGVTSRVPGHEGTDEEVQIRRFINISSDSAPTARLVLNGHAASLRLPPQNGSDGEFTDWIALSQVAAHDLACPRESLAIDIVKNARAPSTYLAEGCGSRGLFVKNGAGTLVLSSLVSIGSPANHPAR